MKKIIFTALISSFLFCTNAFSKTEGNYVSGSVLYNKTKVKQDETVEVFGGNTRVIHRDARSDSAGVGIAYRYAFNHNGFFLAPGIFAEKNNSKSLIGSSSLNIQNRYGLKADLGYDLEDDLAIYVVGGVSYLKYRLSDSLESRSSNASNSFFYGIGLSHDYSNRVSFNIEYNTQKFKINGLEGDEKIRINNDVVKIGLAYKF